MLVCRQWAEVIIVIPIALIMIIMIFITILRLVTSAGLSSIFTWTGLKS